MIKSFWTPVKSKSSNVKQSYWGNKSKTPIWKQRNDDDRLGDEENIKKHYGWYSDSEKKRRKKPIAYNKYKKEFQESERKSKTPEEQERLKNLKEGIKQTLKDLED